MLKGYWQGALGYRCGAEDYREIQSCRFGVNIVLPQDALPVAVLTKLGIFKVPSTLKKSVCIFNDPSTLKKKKKKKKKCIFSSASAQEARRHQRSKLWVGERWGKG
jgi:hypothetical protein